MLLDLTIRVELTVTGESELGCLREDVRGEDCRGGERRGKTKSRVVVSLCMSSSCVGRAENTRRGTSVSCAPVTRVVCTQRPRSGRPDPVRRQ